MTMRGIATLMLIAATANGESSLSIETVPVELVNNFPILEVAIGGERIPLMFDLGGTDEIVLSSRVLGTLQVEPLEETYAWVDAKGNRLESRRFRVPELRIGSLVFRNVSGHEDAEAATYRKTPTGEGYLGAAFIRPFKLVVDYGRQTMTFIPRNHPNAAQHGCHGTEVPFDLAWDGDPVSKSTIDLGEIVLVWDTGAPMSLIRGELVKGNGKTSDDLFYRSEKFVLGSKDFGPVQFRVFNFAEPAGVDGFVGHDFFASHVVCIDLEGRRFLARPNS